MRAPLGAKGALLGDFAIGSMAAALGSGQPRRMRQLDPRNMGYAGAVLARYTPWDMTTLFQDSTGLTPVTAVEQPVGLMRDTGFGKFHARQATAASRPVLSGRYNRLTNTGMLLGTLGALPTDWIERGSVTGVKVTDAATDSGFAVRMTSGGGTVGSTDDLRIASSGLVVGASHTARFKAKLGPGAVGTTLSIVWCASGASVTLTADYQTFSVPKVASGVAHSLFLGGANGLVADIADVEALPDAEASRLPYQRVNTSTDYETAGFPLYLRPDGVDDGMVTDSIDLSGANKMTLLVGVTKLSDAARAWVVQIEGGAGAQRIGLEAPSSALGNYVGWSGGSANTTVGVTAAAPDSSVLVVRGDIPGDLARLRRNGSQVATSTGDQGTGNYANAVLRVASSSGANFFNGRFYGMTLCGDECTDIEITREERRLVAQMGLTL